MGGPLPTFVTCSFWKWVCHICLLLSVKFMYFLRKTAVTLSGKSQMPLKELLHARNVWLGRSWHDNNEKDAADIEKRQGHNGT